MSFNYNTGTIGVPPIKSKRPLCWQSKQDLPCEIERFFTQWCGKKTHPRSKPSVEKKNSCPNTLGGDSQGKRHWFKERNNLCFRVRVASETLQWKSAFRFLSLAVLYFSVLHLKGGVLKCLWSAPKDCLYARAISSYTKCKQSCWHRDR